MKPFQKAISAVNKHGALLVFPIKGKPVPSLWNEFFPSHTMTWDWSSDGSNRIPMLWHLRTELSESKEIVYVKWYQGRATLFSRDLFTVLLSGFSSLSRKSLSFNQETSLVYETLMDDSPTPTRKLKKRLKMESDGIEITNFDRALKPLWSYLFIVGCGEEDEGGFPSLAIGTTKNLHEHLWDQSLAITKDMREKSINETLKSPSPFLKHFRKLESSVRTG